MNFMVWIRGLTPPQFHRLTKNDDDLDIII